MLGVKIRLTADIANEGAQRRLNICFAPSKGADVDKPRSPLRIAFGQFTPKL